MKQFYLHDHESFQIAINAIKDLWPQVRDEKLRFTIDIGNPGDPYSTEQLNKAHALFGDIAVATANAPDIIKEVIMAEAFPPDIFEFEGEMHEMRKSFTKLNKEQASYLINFTIAWAGDKGFYLE